MTKQKSKIISKYPTRRRTTFKKHSKHYAKVYAPYLPAVIGLVAGFYLLVPGRVDSAKSVLSYSTSTSASSLLEQTNDRRADNGAGTLNIDSSLAKAAQQKAQDMAARNYWSHNTPDGRQPWSFIDKAGYEYSEAAENLAYGFGSSKDTVNGWMNSREHREALLNKDFSDVGFGIANSADYQNHGPETIVVALYAQPQKPHAASQVNADFINNGASPISFGQVLTGGKSPWINLLGGIIIGVTAMYLATKHSLQLRRKMRHGEQYILRHPLVDASLLAILVMLVALSRTVGFIQ